jgi:hypothetical protein
MANRTIKFTGQGYGESPVSVTATVDGTTVFSGTVPTTTGWVKTLTADQVDLFSFELPIEFEGTKDVSLAVTGDNLYIAAVYANFVAVNNPIYSEAEMLTLQSTSERAEKNDIYFVKANPPLTDEEKAILETSGPTAKAQRRAIYPAHNLVLRISGGADSFSEPLDSSNVLTDITVNGTAVPAPSSNPGDPVGQWGFEVPGGGSVTCKLNIKAGL